MGLSVATQVKTYRGTKRQVATQFAKEAEVLAREGYRPVAQSWAPFSRKRGAWVLALVIAVLAAVFLPLGVALVLVAVLLVPLVLAAILTKPQGTMAVTYTRDEAPPPQPASRPPSILTDRLTQLTQARDAGLISPQEHDAKRAELLAQF